MMKDTMHHLLQQKNIEFIEVHQEFVLNACVQAHMTSKGGDNCKPTND